MDQYQADSGRNAGSDVRDKKKIRRIRFDPVRTLQFRIIRILSVFKLKKKFILTLVSF